MIEGFYLATGAISTAIQKQSLRDSIVSDATFGAASAIGNWGAILHQNRRMEKNFCNFGTYLN
jgi:hypothetical protein